MMALGGHPRDLEETAARQVERLGYGPEDVRHIVLTHFHYDHAGGLPDFPRAKVHIFRDEYEAVTKPQDVYERYPYRAEHWPHGPDWVVHPLQGDEWFGFVGKHSPRLRTLLRAHGDQVRLACSHDPHELEKFR